MNPTAALVLVTAIAISTIVIMVGIFFVSNLAHAYSFCKTVDNRLVCTTSPGQVCTYYGPNSVVCDSPNSQAISDVPDISDDD